MLYYGAQYNLEQLLTTHLFVLSPNNSGSTFVKNALATSHHTWNLKREGQHAFGFAGPNPIKLNAALLWAADPEVLTVLANREAYNWPQIKKTWYFQSFANSAGASVFVEKSPPFLLHLNALAEHFCNAKFLIMVRNPFAVAEGILRRTRESRPDAVRQAAAHIVTALQLQKENVARAGSRGVSFSYETLCQQPDHVRDQVIRLVPELTDLNFDQRIPVKGMYDEPLRNMNEEQIARLSNSEVTALEEYFDGHRDILSFFSYPAAL